MGELGLFPFLIGRIRTLRAKLGRIAGMQKFRFLIGRITTISFNEAKISKV